MKVDMKLERLLVMVRIFNDKSPNLMPVYCKISRNSPVDSSTRQVS